MGDVGGKGGGLNYEGNAKGNKNDQQKKFVIQRIYDGFFALMIELLRHKKISKFLISLTINVFIYLKPLLICYDVYLGQFWASLMIVFMMIQVYATLFDPTVTKYQ